jgi:glycosyltransferase involved in cell wall biosynthesis
MNVLFIGHLHELSGWGMAAKNYLRALLTTGHNVIARSIVCRDPKVQLSPEIEETLNKPIPSQIDYTIQNVLPNFMSWNEDTHNIGLFFTETVNIQNTPWIDNLKLMDELWVPNTDMLEEFSILNKPIRYMPCPVEHINSNIEPLDINTNGKYVFYFIGELNKRKNIETLIRAYHREFSNNEPVSLLLKVYQYGVPNNIVNQEINRLIRDIKTEMRMYSTLTEYNNEIIVTEYMHRDILLRLHKSCDCFVIPSYGEGMCLPAVDALAVGNLVLGTNFGGPKDFLPKSCKVNGRLEPISGYNTVPGFGTARELWCSIDPLDLQIKMRAAYNGTLSPTISKSNIETLTYDIIGKEMEKAFVNND